MTALSPVDSATQERKATEFAMTLVKGQGKEGGIHIFRLDEFGDDSDLLNLIADTFVSGVPSSAVLLVGAGIRKKEVRFVATISEALNSAKPAIHAERWVEGSCGAASGTALKAEGVIPLDRLDKAFELAEKLKAGWEG